MVLTDREIEIAISQGDIVITPLPNMKEALSSTSIDLTLSKRFSEWKPTPGVTVRPGAVGYKHSHTDHLRNTFDAPTYTLKANSFVLAWTAEYVRLPLKSRIAARVEGKSTLARLGVSVHVTAPTIHSDFKGNIQLEMFNYGKLPRPTPFLLCSSCGTAFAATDAIGRGEAAGSRFPADALVPGVQAAGMVWAASMSQD